LIHRFGREWRVGANRFPVSSYLLADHLGKPQAMFDAFPKGRTFIAHRTGKAMRSEVTHPSDAGLCLRHWLYGIGFTTLAAAVMTAPWSRSEQPHQFDGAARCFPVRAPYVMSALAWCVYHFAWRNTMSDDSSLSPLSLPELEDRIAIVRDNIRQLIEQAAALSGAADEARNADRIAQQNEELERLIKERDSRLSK
jgi:uncharacterized small protein (DUF1192 family)